MERITEIEPAWDKRSADPNKNYGISAVTLRFVLKGELGAVQFVIFTGWYLPEIRDEKGLSLTSIRTPMAYDLGYHSPKPMYDGQQKMTEKCPCLNGKPCYYDGSTLNAEPVLDIMVRQGGEAMWKELENAYLGWFGELR